MIPHINKDIEVVVDIRVPIKKTNHCSTRIVHADCGTKENKVKHILHRNKNGIETDQNHYFTIKVHLIFYFM